MAAKTVNPKLGALTTKLFEEIGRLACDTDALQQDEPDASAHPHRVELQLLELRRVIRHIGWLADKGAHWNGGIHQREGANDWLCSPLLAQALVAAENEAHGADTVDADAVPS